MKLNGNSWASLRMFSKDASPDCFFGPTVTKEKTSYLYPDEKVAQYETVVWNPKMHVIVTLKSYERAHREKDEAALGKIKAMGCPLNLTFGGCVRLA